MSKNIEININSGNNTYETLFPVTDYNILQNKPTIPTVPSFPLSVSNGGTGVTSYSALANQLNNYISTGAKLEWNMYTGTGTHSSSNYVTISLYSGTTHVIFWCSYTRGDCVDGTKGLGDIVVAPIIFTVNGSYSNMSICVPSSVDYWDGSSLTGTSIGPGYTEVKYSCVKNTSLTIVNDTTIGIVPVQTGSSISSWNRYTAHRIFNHSSYFQYIYICVIP